MKIDVLNPQCTCSRLDDYDISGHEPVCELHDLDDPPEGGEWWWDASDNTVIDAATGETYDMIMENIDDYLELLEQERRYEKAAEAPSIETIVLVAHPDDGKYRCTCHKLTDASVTLDSEHHQHCQLNKHTGWKNRECEWHHRFEMLVYRANLGFPHYACICGTGGEYLCLACHVERDDPAQPWSPLSTENKSITDMPSWVRGEHEPHPKAVLVEWAEAPKGPSNAGSKHPWDDDNDDDYGYGWAIPGAHTPTAKTTSTYGSSYGTNYGPKCKRHYQQPFTLPSGTVIYGSSSHSHKVDEPGPDYGVYALSSWPATTISTYIPWTDFGLPRVSAIQVIGVLTDHLELARQGFTIEFGCQGGHGRTGTMLAIMAVLDGAEPQAAIESVWSDYCEHALETDNQEWYVHHVHARINGLEGPPTLPKPAPKPIASKSKTHKPRACDHCGAMSETEWMCDTAACTVGYKTKRPFVAGDKLPSTSGTQLSLISGTPTPPLPPTTQDKAAEIGLAYAEALDAGHTQQAGVLAKRFTQILKRGKKR